MGELTVSLAQEIIQPITGAIATVNICLRWLGSDNLDLDQLRTAVGRIKRDVHRAAEIIKRIQTQFERGSQDPTKPNGTGMGLSISRSSEIPL